jgi:hypothetical protein
MKGTLKFDLRKLITGPYIACPECGDQQFGILSVGPGSFRRRCPDCLQDVDYDLPSVHKTIIYLDQFAISNLTSHRLKTKPAEPFYATLYDKLSELSRVQAVVCPYSEAHRIESIVAPNHGELRDTFRLFAHSVRFEDFDEIRSFQVFERLSRWLKNDDSTACTVTRDDVLDGDEPNIWSERFQVSIEMPLADDYVEKLREWRAKSHSGLVGVFENTWKTEAHQTWEYWRDREAKSWGPLLIPIYVRELEKWDDISSGRRQPAGPHEMEPHPFVVLIHEIADKIAQAGCPRDQKSRQAYWFLHSGTLASSPFRRIAGSLYACLARKATAQKKPPNPGFHNDVDVMSCLLPYCDAMFLDNEMANYWREIQGTPTRRLPFETRVFSPNSKDEFIAYLDKLERAVPEEQRRMADEVYG